MLTRAQEKLIRSLETKKGRLKNSRCLVEGAKNIEAAKQHIDFVFTRDDVNLFDELVSTETPQETAAVAHLPSWSEADITDQPIIVVLDGVQDPGNVGAIFRLAQGFSASVILVESADPSSPKVIRSSAGAFFSVPSQSIKREDAVATIKKVKRPIYRLEQGGTTKSLREPCVLIVGSEGAGIQLDIVGTSVSIPHNDSLESLNVGHALAIILAEQYKIRND